MGLSESGKEMPLVQCRMVRVNGIRKAVIAAAEKSR